MNPWIKIAVVLAILATAFSGGVAASRNHYLTIIAQMKQKAAEEAQKAAEVLAKTVQDNSKFINDLEVQHEADKKAVADLFSSISGMRVELPACPSGEAVTAAGSASSVAGSQPLPVNPQIAFDEFTKQLEEQARYADEVVASCRVLKLWALSQ